jgi:hypothetical protein
VGDTELVANVEDAEEEIETEAKEDNGEIELTAFNLKVEPNCSGCTQALSHTHSLCSTHTHTHIELQFKTLEVFVG